MPAVARPTDYPDAIAARRYASGKTAKAVTVSSAGDTTVVTPTSGKAIRLLWLGLSTSENAGGETLVRPRFGDNDPIYSWWMGSPGAFQHWQVYEGADDEPLIVALSDAIDVEVNLTYEEI